MTVHALVAGRPSDALRRQIVQHTARLRRALGWPDVAITLARGRCAAPFAAVHVELDGWHLRSQDGRRRWLGRSLEDAAAELERIVEGA